MNIARWKTKNRGKVSRYHNRFLGYQHDKRIPIQLRSVGGNDYQSPC